MKRFISALCISLLAACHSHESGHSHGEVHGHDEPHGHGHDEAHGHGAESDRPALSFTHWSGASELFIELPALVRGLESPCAAHVTQLDGFRALADGRVSVVLQGDGGEERFDIATPSVPGIFRPVVRPKAAGRRRLVVEVHASTFSADHDLGEVVVFESPEAARAGLPEEAEVPGRIAFLKEQQWPIAFATEVVTERVLRPSLAVTGRITPRADGEVVVAAPVAGRVATSGRPLPRLGERVEANDLLGVLAPRLEAADLASLELAVTSAQLQRRFADQERQRVEALRNQGAIPERRLQDALHAAEAATAALEAAERRLEQFRRVQQTAGRSEGTVQLRAPLSGTVTEVLVAPGTFVEAGAPLLRVTDLTQLWLEAHVPEAYLPRLDQPRGASFRLDGDVNAVPLPPEAFVARGGRVDPQTRALPVVFAVENPAGRLAVGAFAQVDLFHGEERRALAVPEAALIDDGGFFVTFVQVEGEAFERRPLKLGMRDAGFVEVLAGLSSGERVVTTGAWSVKLAGSSGAIPAHGHSH